MEHSGSSRCGAEAISDQLKHLLQGLPFLAERPWQEVGSGRMRIELLNLWRIELLLRADRPASAASADQQQDRLVRVDRATAPDGRCWEYGCQRDDWRLGPDSRLIEPLQFLSSHQRQGLQAALENACCWPDPSACDPIEQFLPAAELVLNKRRSRPPARRQHWATRSRQTQQHAEPP